MKTVVPSILALTFFGIYTIVDGYFVGNRVGDDGLTAIGLAYPFVAVLLALGTGIGMGGAILQTISRAAGEKERAARYTGVTLVLLLLCSLLGMLCVPLLGLVLRLIGAEGAVLLYGKQYLRIIFLAAFTQIIGSGLPPLVRNLGGAVFAMGIMVAGCAANILLDYVFVMRLDFGVAGAAWATVLGQLIPTIGGVLYVAALHREGMQPVAGLHMAVNVLKNGAASFGITLCPSVGLFLMNLFAVRYGGLPAVTCYTVVAYMTWIVYLVLQGTADGCQPLISETHGKNNAVAMDAFVKRGYVFALVLAVVCVAVLYLLRDLIGPAFGASDAVAAAVGDVLPVLLAGFVPLAYARITAARLYGTADAGRASALTYAEFGFLLLFLVLLPPFGGLRMVWWSMTLSQWATAILAAVLISRTKM